MKKSILIFSIIVIFVTPLTTGCISLDKSPTSVPASSTRLEYGEPNSGFTVILDSYGKPIDLQGVTETITDPKKEAADPIRTPYTIKYE